MRNQWRFKSRPMKKMKKMKEKWKKKRSTIIGWSISTKFH